MDLVFALVGCLLFSGYIVYDTYLINKRLSPDEWVLASLSLYLECVLIACYRVLFAYNFLFQPFQLHQSV